MAQKIDNHQIDILLQLAIETAVKAGAAIMAVYHELDHEIEIKADKSFLTKADKLAHDIIEDCLKDTGIPILSEEGHHLSYEVRKNWKQLWIIDPLDGTKEFINRNGEFTVNIALVENEIPILGVVFCPALGTMFYGTEEHGSYKLFIHNLINATIDRKEAHKLPLYTSPSVYTVVASRSHLSDETVEFIDGLQKEKGTIEMISQGSSMKFCLVAKGQAHCYPRFAPTMEWDTAAGHAVCKYAGFDVIDWKTKKEKRYNKPELRNNYFVVKK
jgi:3'(2'), 5'-bisphosphate nucleotidase